MFKPPQNPSNTAAASKRRSFGFPTKNSSSEQEVGNASSTVDNRRFSPTPLSNRKTTNGLLRSKSVSNRYSLPASKITSRPSPLPRISSPPLSSSASDVSTSSTASCLSSKTPSVFKPPLRPLSPSQFQIGDRIQVDSMGILGTLRFIGGTKFKPGIWAGIELDQPGTGKNDGVVDGIKYFTCAPKSGLFILAHKISKVTHSTSSELSKDCLTSTKTVKRASVPTSLYKPNLSHTNSTQKRASFGFKGHRSVHTYGTSPSYSNSPSSSPSPTLSIKAPPTPSRSSTPIKGMQLEDSSINSFISKSVDDTQNTFTSHSVGNDTDVEDDSSHNLQLKLEVLQAENEFLKLEVKQIKSNSEMGILKAEIESLRRQKQEWEKEKLVKSQLVDLLESEMNDLKNQFSDLKLDDQLTSIDSTVEQDSSPSDTNDANVDKLLSIIKDVKAALKIRSAIEKEFRDRIMRLEASNNGELQQNELVETLQSELEERSIEVGKLTARLDRAKSDFEKEKSQLIENFKNVEKNDYPESGAPNDDQEDVNNLLKKIQQYEITIKSQEKLLRDFKAAGAEAFDHYERSLQSIKKENFSLKEQAENVVNVCRQLESDAESLRLELEKAKVREEELFKESTSLQEAVDNYQLSNLKRKEEIQKLKLELQRQNNEILNLTKKQESGMENLSFDGEKDKLLSQIEELLSSINSLEAERSCIVKAHEELLESHDKTKTEMSDIRILFDQFDVERHAWVEQRTNLQQQIDTFREMIEVKDRELQGIKDELTQLNVFLEEKNLEIDVLRSKISELETQSHTEMDASKISNTEVDHEAEITKLKKKLEYLEKEHSAILNENIKLQEEHAELTEAQEKLLEMHTHMETECLKLMEEVEKLHSESLENSALSPSMDAKIALQIDAHHKHDSQELDDLQISPYEKEKALAEVKQQYKMEIREMQKRITELELSKQHDLDIRAKDIAELESLVESKIFRETELEEQIAELKQTITLLETKLENAKSNSTSSRTDGDIHTLDSDEDDGLVQLDLDKPQSQASYLPTDEEELFCELCDSKGHDVLSCTEYSLTEQDYSNQNLNDDMYCENCEEYGDHWTDDCPNQDETF